jgi:hypothetical protein
MSLQKKVASSAAITTRKTTLVDLKHSSSSSSEKTGGELDGQIRKYTDFLNSDNRKKPSNETTDISVIATTSVKQQPENTSTNQETSALNSQQGKTSQCESRLILQSLTTLL